MALRFLVGPAGSGKTRTAFDRLIEASLRNTGRSLSFVIVPEQYSLQTQMDMMERHPRHGSMAIDVISFERLAWMIIEEAENIGCWGKRCMMMLVFIMSLKEPHLGLPGLFIQVRTFGKQNTADGQIERYGGMVDLLHGTPDPANLLLEFLI